MIPSGPLLVSLVLAMLLGTACVSASRHQETAAERNQLAAENRDLGESLRLLEISNEGLEDEVAGLKDQREDLLLEQERLTSELEARTTSEEQLALRLRTREEELSLTASALIEQSRKVEALQTTYDALVGDLEAELASGEIKIEQLRDGLQVDVAQDILFPSGSASVSPGGTRVLATVAERLAPLAYRISVEGHTDTVPISSKLRKQYPSNWELAGARAASVVRLFVDAGIDGAKLTAVSHGQYQPVAPGNTAADRALNRRIEIRLRPDDEADGAAVPAQ